MRKFISLFTRVVQVLFNNKLSKSDSTKEILFFPPFQDENDLGNHINRIRWYLPDNNSYDIYIIVAKNLLKLNLTDLSTPEGQRNDVNTKSNVKVTEISKLNFRISQANIIAVWNTNSNWKRLFFKKLFAIRIVDPNYFKFTETHTYPGLLWHDFKTAKQKKQERENSFNKYKCLTKSHNKFNKAYIFGTGPSINNLKNYKYDDGIKIICNSMVKNDEMLEYIKPDILVFTDSVFHFGVSEYSQQFLNDVLKVVKRYNVYCITNEVGCALLKAHYSNELKNNLIAVPASRFGKPKPLTITNFKTRDYTNVLTRYMLPLAAGLADEVQLIGFDGRKPEENYFWNHNQTTQYNTSMDSTKLSHPAFFRDVNYEGYYDGHCKNLDIIFNEYEKRNKIFKVLSNSYIPSLRKRM